MRGIHRSPVNSPHKGQWRGALMFSLICAWINGWVNNHEAGDLRRHRAHYDVTAMEHPETIFINPLNSPILTETDWDWDKFIQHNMTLYRCMISDIHDSSYVLFRTNLISNTSLHVGRPLLRPCLVAYAEATLARQKDSATNEKCWHHFRILIVDKWSVVWNECKKSWVPNDRLEKPLIPCNMISN